MALKLPGQMASLSLVCVKVCKNYSFPRDVRKRRVEISKGLIGRVFPASVVIPFLSLGSIISVLGESVLPQHNLI